MNTSSQPRSPDLLFIWEWRREIAHLKTEFPDCTELDVIAALGESAAALPIAVSSDSTKRIEEGARNRLARLRLVAAKIKPGKLQVT